MDYGGITQNEWQRVLGYHSLTGNASEQFLEVDVERGKAVEDWNDTERRRNALETVLIKLSN